jgi:hypothetical protein
MYDDSEQTTLTRQIATLKEAFDVIASPQRPGPNPVGSKMRAKIHPSIVTMKCAIG